MRKRIYIAGPYSGSNIMGILGNIRNGQKAAAYLMLKGHAVFCPFLDYQLALTVYGASLRKNDFQESSMAWVDVSDAVYVVGNWRKSEGTVKEIERANQFDIPVFYDLIDITRWSNQSRRKGKGKHGKATTS